MKLLPAALQSVSAGKAEAVPNPAHPAARCQPGGGCCHLVKALTRFYPRIGGLFPWVKAPSLPWARRCIAEHFSSLAPPLFLLLHHSSSFSTALPHPLPFFLLLLCSSSSTTSPPPPLFFLLLHLFLHHPGRCQLPAASSARDLPAAPSARAGRALSLSLKLSATPAACSPPNACSPAHVTASTRGSSLPGSVFIFKESSP